jgi:hypothetical protein
MLSRTISLEIPMLPDNGIRITGAIYASWLALDDARDFFRTAEVDLPIN